MKKKALLIGVIIAIVVLVLLVTGFLSGWFSLAGKTVSAAPDVTASTISGVPSCVDSDGTDNWSSKGTVTLKYADGTSETKTDVCEEDATVDYFCEQYDSSGTASFRIGRSASTHANCVCQDGACIAPAVACSDTECNPSNSIQICSNGQWTNCPNDQVCSLGSCVTPRRLGSASTFASGEGDSDSGGSGGSSGSPATSTPAEPEPTVRPLGVISGSSTQEISINEKITFTVSGVSHSLTLTSLSETGAILKAGTGATLTLSAGDETQLDGDSNGSKELGIKLKSINSLSKQAKVILTEL